MQTRVTSRVMVHAWLIVWWEQQRGSSHSSRYSLGGGRGVILRSVTILFLSFFVGKYVFDTFLQQVLINYSYYDGYCIVDV